MNNKLYVGNLTFDTTDRDLENLFSQAGTVKEVALITDKLSGKSRGFGFVVMSDAAGAQAAIEQFHNRDFGGRNLTVNEAREREERPSGGRDRDRRPSRRY